jgi:hypothetical protein
MPVPYNWTWTNTTLPKLTDKINATSQDWSGLMTYSWTQFLGIWFFAFVIGIIGAGIQVKYKNMTVTAGYFIVMIALFSVVLKDVGYIFGIMIALVIGFLLFYILKDYLR